MALLQTSHFHFFLQKVTFYISHYYKTNTLQQLHFPTSNPATTILQVQTSTVTSLFYFAPFVFLVTGSTSVSDFLFSLQLRSTLSFIADSPVIKLEQCQS